MSEDRVDAATAVPAVLERLQVGHVWQRPGCRRMVIHRVHRDDGLVVMLDGRRRVRVTVDEIAESWRLVS